MAKIRISEFLLFVVWAGVVVFVCSVGSDVFDHAPQDDCNFCAVANYTTKVRILNENEKLVGFKSKDPECYKHYLVIPKEHIKNIHSEEATCELIEEMRSFCNSMLDEEGILQGRKMIFHNPPFYSVKHLHLHCMACNSNDESFGSLQYYFNLFHRIAEPDLSYKCKSL